MYPHLCRLLTTFCINAPNSSYSCVLQWSFGQPFVIQCHSCFFWYSFPSNSSSQSAFFLLPISASLCLSAYLFFVAYRSGDKLSFSKGRALNASQDLLYLWFSQCPHWIYTILPGKYVSMDTGTNCPCVWRLKSFCGIPWPLFCKAVMVYVTVKDQSIVTLKWATGTTDNAVLVFMGMFFLQWDWMQSPKS